MTTMSTDFTQPPEDLRTVAALAEQQLHDFREQASNDRPEFTTLTHLHRFRLSIDGREQSRLEFRSSSKQLAFTVHGNGACQTVSVFVDVAAYLALYYRTPDWEDRLLARYALMSVKVAAAKLGTLSDEPCVQRELSRLAPMALS